MEGGWLVVPLPCVEIYVIGSLIKRAPFYGIRGWLNYDSRVLGRCNPLLLLLLLLLLLVVKEWIH